MPTFQHGSTRLHYEVTGDGPPLLLLAPGGMRSSIPFWQRAPFHPVLAFSDRFRVIAMDQRNAGQSSGEISADHGWHTYAEDQLALLDHLRIARCAVFGGCVGGAFALKLAELASERVSALVLQQPIGFDGRNRSVFYELFASWQAELASSGRALDEPALKRFKHALYDGDFVFSVTPESVRRCRSPMLVLRGNDVYHPARISEQIARLAPNAELIRTWREGEHTRRAVARVRTFLTAHAAR